MYFFRRYAPTKYAPPPASRPQAALSAVQSLDSLEVIGKIVRNIVVAPADAKFRRIKLANAKVTRPPQIASAALTMCWQLCGTALPVWKTLLLSCALMLSAPGPSPCPDNTTMWPAARLCGKPGA